MTDRLDQLDYYTLLGLEPSATMDQVKQAFHQFARKYHPDRFAAAPPDKRQRAAQIFRRGTEGFGVLTNPAKRRAYDAGLQKGQLRYDASSAEAATGGGAKAAAAKQARAIPPKARPLVAKARSAIKAEDWQTARLNLQLALGHAPNNEELKAMLEDVKAKLHKPPGR